MRLLCVVNSFLQKILSEVLKGSDLVFYNQWEEASRELTQHRFEHVFIFGELVEDGVAPILLWSVASQMRLLGVKGTFIGLSYDGTRILREFYPETTYLAYPNSASEFFLDLQTCCPEIFSETHRAPSDSSIGRRRLGRSVLPDVSASSELGVRRNSSQHSSQHSSQAPGRSVESLAAVSSLPLGYSAARRNIKNSLPENEVKRNDEDSSGLQMLISGMCTNSDTVSDISGIISTGDSAIERALCDSSEEAAISNLKLREPSNHQRHNPIAASMSAVGQKAFDPFAESLHASQNENAHETPAVTIKRTSTDIQFGRLEFSSLMRIMMQIHQMGLTGVLEVKNDTRRIHIEYKDGEVASNSQVSFVESACLWEAGEYNFNATALLSRDCGSFDLPKLITRVVMDQLSLNQILYALGSEMQHYILITNIFDEAQHKHVPANWWSRCLGETRFNDLVSTGEIPMDVLARDVFRAWVCDEIIFTDEVSLTPAQITYVATPRVNTHTTREKSRLSLDASNDSHLDAIKSELNRIRESFEHADGYTILGLKQGCGTKALDDAYYAWINRYHTDRYVRYKDAELVQLANDLVMLMNNVYPRLSKSERIGGSSASRSTASPSSSAPFESGIGNPRIGSTRHRLSTLSSNEKKKLSSDNEKITHVSKEFHNLTEGERSNSNQRVYIRPSSSGNISGVQRMNSQSEMPRASQRMSDYLAEKRSAQNLRQELANQAAKNTQENAENARSAIRNSVRSLRPVVAQVTPEQSFQTGRKKLLLDLIPDALEAFQQACEGEPNNREYRANFLYAQAMADSSKCDSSLKELKEIIANVKQELTLQGNKELRGLVFSLFYFCGKIELSMDSFTAAMEDFEVANRINPADIDTQRCMRYIQQCEKAAEASAKPKEGFFARIKDQLNKNI